MCVRRVANKTIPGQARDRRGIPLRYQHARVDGSVVGPDPAPEEGRSEVRLQQVVAVERVDALHGFFRRVDQLDQVKVLR